MKYKTILLIVYFLTRKLTCHMLRNQCHRDEVHRSCSFYEEYTCWQNEDRLIRVKIIPKRLPHCRSGCYCKKGLVRAYPQGPCVPAIYCRNHGLQKFLSKLPSSFLLFS
ncbi:uncharacterized protein [Battus philenor]|uniref:uncharacterized protein n=1 Tax=Battus philenor TaxID=42288 RepID=UPI0035D12670